MSTLVSTAKETSPPPGAGEGPADAISGPNLNALEDRVPRWLQAPRVAALWVTILGLLYLILSYQPLWHTDLWGHLSYGRWIWEHGQLPTTEPLMPLAEGVPFIDTPWLTQLMGYGLYSKFGTAAMQFCYAATITASLALLLFAVLHRTKGSIPAGITALAVFLVVDYQQLLVIRPQLAGLVCFVAVFAIVVAFPWRAGFWLLVPAIFALWANLHGSFIMGLGLLAVCCMGRAIDVYRASGKVRRVWNDPRVRRWFLLTELSAVAVLINPYGLGLYAEVLAVSRNPNLQSLREWAPLTLRMSQGKAAAVCALALMAVYRFSPREVRATEFLLLIGLGGAALWSSRMIVWWGPVAAYYLALHLAAILRSQRVIQPRQSPRSGKWTVITVGLAWIFFAYTPFGNTLLHGPPKTPEARRQRLERSTSAQTPLTVADYFLRHPPQGLVFSKFDWGDYLQWAGPPDLQLFATSHVHLMPEPVWSDYLAILNASHEWEKKLDTYGVNVVAVDKRQQQVLIKALKSQKDQWQLDFEDQRSIVLSRRDPI